MGGVFLPLLALVFVSASVILCMAIVITCISEISDRFLFYTTVVPLDMAGGFFVAKQR